MKPGRQNVILDIISNQDIETQFDLMRELSKRGIKSTQATLSRDIKEMRLVKETKPDGRSKYVKSSEADSRAADIRLRTILKDSVLSIDRAQNLVVIKTLPGLAPGACSVLDGMVVDGLVGTIAGDDTVFLAMRDDTKAILLIETIETII